MTIVQQTTVSLRNDLPKNVQWSGLSLQSNVDMVFWIERCSEQGTNRIVQAVLVRPGLRLPLQPLCDFDLEILGNDCVRLETLGREMVVVGNHVRSISAVAEPTQVKFLIDIAGSEIGFVGVTGIMGRWDWLVNPAESEGAIYVQSAPISQVLAQAAA